MEDLNLTRSLAFSHDVPVAYSRSFAAGVPFVLLHGIGSSSANFASLSASLTQAGRSVIAIDLPGHGASPHAPGAQGVDHLADAVRAVLDVEGVDKAHLVGHSLGGGLAILLAAAQPERFVSLSLSASAGLGESTSMLLRLGSSLPGAGLGLRAGVNPVTVSVARAAARALSSLGAHPYELSESVIDLLDSLSDPQHQHAFMETLRDAVDAQGQRRSGLEALEGMDASRVLLVTCESDPVIPSSHALAAHRRLDGSSLMLLEGKSHEPHVAHALEFSDAVLAHAQVCERSLSRGMRPARSMCEPALASAAARRARASHWAR